MASGGGGSDSDLGSLQLIKMLKIPKLLRLGRLFKANAHLLTYLHSLSHPSIRVSTKPLRLGRLFKAYAYLPVTRC